MKPSSSSSATSSGSEPGEAEPVRHLSEREALALAVCVWLGALAALPVPVWPACAVVLVSFLWRRPLLLVVGAAALAGGLARSAMAPVDLPPDPRGEEAVLVDDPEAVFHELVAEVVLDGTHLRLQVDPADAPALAGMLAGEEIQVSGRVRALRDGEAWLRDRHVVGLIEADRVERSAAGALPAQAANVVRRNFDRGAGDLDGAQRSLLAGLVLGDDRGRDVLVEERFRAAGLSHMLVVSGQNVTVAMALVGPLLRRLPGRGRLVGVVVVLVWFALLTRFEPSVLRATVMGAVTAAGAALGRPVSRGRTLCLAVTALVLVDPLLVRLAGFQLSVAACAGIVVLAERIRERLPGPPWLAEAASVTIAAQVAVAPILMPLAGGIPVVAVPANVLAAPAAAAALVWGLSAGTVAGLVPSSAGVLHLPTQLLLWWLSSVASFAARLRLGELGWLGLASVVLGGAVLLGLRSEGGRRRGLRRLATATLVITGVLPGAVLRMPPEGMWSLGSGVELIRSADDQVVLVVEGGTDPRELLEQLRRRGVGDVDLVVATAGGASVSGVVVLLRRRGGVGAVLAPEGHRIRGAAAVGDGVVRVDGLELVLRSEAERLVLVGANVTCRGAWGYRDPPCSSNSARTGST